MRRAAPAIPLADMLEKQLEQQVIGKKAHPGLARMLGWRCYHTLRSQGSEPGFPDWCLVRERVVYLELKREKGIVSDAQVLWLTALRKAHAEVYLVRPRHLEAIAAVLQARVTPIVGTKPGEPTGLLPLEPILTLTRELDLELSKKEAA